MTETLRILLAAVSALILGAVMVVGMLDMPAAGATIASYGVLLTELAVTERNALNTVSGVLFDLRALDTLGELLALFTASAGLHVVLRGLAGESEREEPQPSRRGRLAVPVSDAVRTLCFAVATPTLIYGVYISTRAHLTVGGGFQGGVIIAAALFLLYLAGRYDVQEEIAEDEALDLAEAIGMGGYVIVGLAGLVTAGAFLANMLPLGTPGDLLSAGAIPILSILVGIEAAAAGALIVSHMQEQPLEREGRP